MTTQEAEARYLLEHVTCWNGTPYAVYNPHNKPIEELPVIWGFNNGGSPGWFCGRLIAEDGTSFGSHICSHEGYMPADLGVLDGSRPDRHERFREHYPDGYRMDFVPYHQRRGHKGLEHAYELNQKLAEQKDISE